MNKLRFPVSLFLVMLVMAISGCSTKKAGSSAASPPLASSPATVETRSAPVLPVSAANPPAAFEGEGWQSMFDGKSLAGWRPTAFSGHGEIGIESGALILNMGDPFTGINWTNPFPKVNYEIAFDAMRLSGSDFFCGLTVPAGDSFCSLIVGGWGGSLVGISSLDGMDASENETTKFDSFETGRWYRVRMRVTGHRLEAWIDKDKLVDAVTTGHTLSVRPGEIEFSEPLGLASWQTGAAYREIKYRTVTGPESPPRKKHGDE